MIETFASNLAEKIQSHKEFWADLALIQSQSIKYSLPDNFPNESNIVHNNDLSLHRLLYSASVFAQTSIERNRFLAQTIVLSILISTNDSRIRERITTILAEIGNFPTLDYLYHHYENKSTSFLSELKIDLLKNLNSVVIADKEIPLTDFQLNVWNDLPNLEAVSISAPTSSGKSFLIIEYICKQVLVNTEFTTIYIAPTRALLAEISRKLTNKLQTNLDIRISTVPSLDSENRKKQIFVLTQERLLVLLATTNLKVNLIVVDEAQNIADGTRGMILQDCLERVKTNNPATQILLLSPGANGFSELGRMLGVDSLITRETTLSPVLQNRIMVKAVDGKPKELELYLLTKEGKSLIGKTPTTRGIADSATRLAAITLELSKDGASLVYATGPSDAEHIASQLASDLPIKTSSKLKELSAFIKKHIHPEYGLAEMVLHGVAFHYGKMPTLLREAIENHFRSGDIQFLVCTTTLFQGINLPARNVFINTPTRGRGAELDAALLWNFAGRAGRLGQDLVGNVFLIDYHNWVNQDLNEPVKYNVSSAFSDVITSNFNKVLNALSGDMPKLSPQDSTPQNIRAAAGLLISRATSNQTTILLERNLNLTNEQRAELNLQASRAVDYINLPKTILQNNWTVNPYGIKKLAEYMRKKIGDGNIEDLIPIHPREDSARKRYAGIFNRINREILGNGNTPFGGLVSTYAIPWMQGSPFPFLLSRWIKYKSEKNANSSINSMVRTGFDFFEDVLRFQMVQLGKAYIDVLEHIMLETNHSHRRSEIFNFSLALELGVCSTSGRAFIELGTSRITASTLESLFPDSELNAHQARKRLAELNVRAVELSPIIIAELEGLGLIRATNSES